MFNIRIAHQNFQSVKNKIEELEILLRTNDIDIMCISESWCNNSEIKLIQINGYQLITHFSRTSSKHGGVAIIVKSHLHATVIPQLASASIDRVWECVGVKLKTENETICVICIYRAPDTNLNDFFLHFENNLNLISKRLISSTKLVVCGDFNIDLLRNTKEKNSLLDITQSFNLYTVFKDPTRIIVIIVQVQ